MPKRKAPLEKPKDQFKRFVEVAKEREVDEAQTEEKFERLANLKRGPKRH
jgi:hypothetical protein